MTDRDAFLAAIVARPADDLPRLVFADWLDEQGEAARAEFVRVQCELAKCPVCTPAGPTTLAYECGHWYGRRRLTDRVSELLELHWHEWSGRIATYCANFHDDGAFGVRFARGFVAELRCDWPACRGHLDAVRREQPVERVVLTTVPDCTVEHDPRRQRYRVTLTGVATDEFYEVGEPWLHEARGADAVRAIAREQTALLLGRVWKGVTFDLPEFGGITMGPPEEAPYTPTDAARLRQQEHVDRLAREAIDRHVRAQARAEAARRELVARYVLETMPNGGWLGGGLRWVEGPLIAIEPGRVYALNHTCHPEREAPYEGRMVRLRPQVLRTSDMRPPEGIHYVRGECERCRVTFIAMVDSADQVRAAIEAEGPVGDRFEWLGPPAPGTLNTFGNFYLDHYCGDAAPTARDAVRAATDPGFLVTHARPPGRPRAIPMDFRGIDVSGRRVIYWRGRCDRCRVTFVSIDG